MINLRRLYNIIGVALLGSVALTSCKDSFEELFGGAPDMEGTQVEFTTDVRTQRVATRAQFDSESAMNTELESYKPINDAYTLNVSMYEEGTGNSIGSANYIPVVVKEENATNSELKPEFQQNPLYWPGNAKRYAFKATCGSETVATDQSSAEKLFAQDKLLGYGYCPSYGEGADDIDGLNYHTNKEWYTANKARLGSGATSEQARRVPLFLQHQRAWLTVILKAGNGIKREFLQEGNKANVSSVLFSYGSGDSEPIEVNKPLVTFVNIPYDKDLNGDAGNFQTTQYDAIVEPHDFSNDLETAIFKVVVNNMKFSYYSANDIKKGTTDEDMSVYNLTAGKHLTITATLSTDRIIFITALLEDWDELTFTSICDDYGQNGDPIQIPDRYTLDKFLKDPNLNKAGNTAIISAANLDLTDTTWTASLYELKANLNLAGATIKTNKQFLGSVASTSTIVNGVISVNGENNGDANGIVDAAICSENHGVIQQVTITTDGKAKATKGAVCDLNTGKIVNCVSYLKVQGTGNDEYVGGIAARSEYASGENPKMPVIDKCVVNGRVSAEQLTGDADKVLGVGGIAGYAEGRISNNTFNYGITILYQDNLKHKNIVAATSAESGKTLMQEYVYNNSWPTTIGNKVTVGTGSSTEFEIPNANSAIYAAVLDCQKELEKLVTLGTAATDLNYRVADDFSLDESWKYGRTPMNHKSEAEQYSQTKHEYNHTFNLDGNGHTITTNGTMLFSVVKGEIKNLNLYCNAPISEEPNTDNTNSVASLAYALEGNKAKLTNVKVNMAEGAYIQSAQPAGLVSWAYGGAVIKDCEVKVALHAKLNNNASGSDQGNDARVYAGGIAAFAVDATFDGCKVHTGTVIMETVEIGGKLHTNFWRGGILGGATKNAGSTTEPNVTIIECCSWWTDSQTNANCGDIVGRSQFAKTTSENANGINAASSGNWWSGTQPAGDLGTRYDKVLGKKNAVTPTEDSNWWK